MKIPRAIHRWNLTPRQAIRLQRRLAARVRQTPLRGLPRLIAGGDATIDPTGACLIAGWVVWDAQTREMVESVVAVRPVRFPYVPGLLSFREAPALIAAARKLRSEPEVFMLDGQGLAHPRRFGLACHVGVLLDRPSLGCAKSLLCGEPEPAAGGQLSAISYQPSAISRQSSAISHQHPARSAQSSEHAREVRSRLRAAPVRKRSGGVASPPLPHGHGSDRLSAFRLSAFFPSPSVISLQSYALSEEAGAWCPLVDGGEVIGRALRTRAGVKPVYVSVGHRLTLDDAVAVALRCSAGFRLPEPARLAHQLVSRQRTLPS